MTAGTAVDELAEYRRAIDAIDLELLRLLNARTAMVERIGELKRRHGIPIYEPKREDEVYRNVLSHNSGPLPPDAVHRIFERIIDEMRTLQKKKRTETPS
jgi:chorismate mutase-like protein